MSVKHSLGKDKINRKIQLKKSSLLDIPLNLYSSLSEITHMDLSYNFLNNKHFDLICISCPSLKRLSIEGNLISLIPNSFKQLQKLQFLRTDWHLIMGDSKDKKQLRIAGCKVIDNIENSRICEIKLFLSQNIRLASSDGLRGINFKKFCQQVCKIQLQPSVCGLLIKRIQSSSIIESLKQEMIGFLHSLSANIGRSDIIAYNTQTNQSLKTLPGLHNAFKKSQNEAKSKSSLRGCRLSIQKARKRCNQDQSLEASSIKKSAFEILTNSNKLSRSQKQIVIQRVQQLNQPKSPIKYPLSIRDSSKNYVQKNISNSSTGISLGMTVILQEDYGVNYPFHKIFSQFQQNPQSNMKQLEKLLRKNKTPNLFDDKGYSPFHLAVINNQSEILRYCIQRNKALNFMFFDLQILSQDQQRNILHISALLKNVEIMKMLVENGYPLNKRDKNGYNQTHLIDQNQQFLANYRKACRKRKWRKFVSEHTKKGVMVSKIQIMNKQRSAKLLQMFEYSVGIHKKNYNKFVPQ